jgi:enamine deaminase RidA (YjgF/YER057c/UK114 family)
MEFLRSQTDAFVFEAPDLMRLALPNDFLGGTTQLPRVVEPLPVEPEGAWRWLPDPAQPELRWGAATIASEGMGMRAATEKLYRAFFSQLDGAWIYRIWNFVPRINEPEDGLETYQHFSFGRSVAFEAAFADVFERRMPAASAVGTPGGRLGVMCLVGPEKPIHVENPWQVPAYHYPTQFGPRSPSFARATKVSVGSTEWIFVSGTAAIRGFESQCRGDLRGQLAMTWENILKVAAEAGCERTGEDCEVRVYLRHKRDFDLIRNLLEAEFLAGGEAVSYLQAEICRADLDVEIEMTVRRPTNR